MRNLNYYNILQAHEADIKSFEGIENFPWITQCNMGGNPELESIDISGLEKVTKVDTGGNTMLSEINLGSNACQLSQDKRIGVEKITVIGSGVTSINLTAYYISGDQLKEFDVTQCPALTSINATGRDQLTTIYITAEQEGKITLSGSSAEFVVR